MSNVFSQRDVEKNLFQFLDLFPAGAFLLDDGFVIIEVNKLALTLIGNEKENVIGRGIIEFVAEKDSNQFYELFQKTSLKSKPKITEIILRKADSSHLSTLVMIKSFRDQDTGKKFFTMAMIDYTPYKMKEEMIRDSEARFKNMANTAPVMIWIADVDGLFSFVNKVWLDYTGEQIGALLGMNWLKSVHPDDYERLLTVYQNAFKSREHFSAEYRFKRMNNEYQWMLINGSPRVSDKGIFAGYIGSCININEQIKNEEKIKKINSELTESNKTKDKFFSIISHDLRGPLSGLMQLLEILADEYDSLNEQEKNRLLSEAATSAKGTYNLMENLLEWSRIQSGKMEYQSERINLLPLVNDVISLYNQIIKNKEINFETSIQTDISVFSDKKMIETILRNLISNAIKFTRPKGTVALSSKKDNNFVTLKVEDTGVGISEEDLIKIFRLDIGHSTKGTAKESGTGLGLILCKELVEKQGGKIWVESKFNEGSSFYFTIPLAK